MPAALRHFGTVSSLFVLLALSSSLAPGSAKAIGECCYEAPQGPLSQNCNVIWIADDQITGCPAGDSVNVFVAGHPMWLRIRVHYEDNNCTPRVGVHPESIWVKYKSIAGNLVLNDKGSKVFADDYTDAYGDTWIMLKSFSGCGTIRCSLFVSGKFSGYKDRLVRTTDQNANGRTEASEGASPCDLNYDGIPNDGSYRQPHLDDWHRNALHGTLVKRTSLCDTCAVGQPNTIGDGKFAWSPSGRYVSFDIEDPVLGCKIYLAASDPALDNNLTQFTFPTVPVDSADYDASWSPLGDEIVFQRRDRIIYRKPVPWLGTSEIPVVAEQSVGITYPAISPDGKTIAYVRVAGTDAHIYAIPVTGGIVKQVTSGSGVFDRYPEWSPDGRLLVFERRTGGQVHLYKVAPGDAAPTAVPFYTPSDAAAVLPAYSPDSMVIAAGLGPSGAPITATIETAPSGSPKAITSNYPAHTYSHLSPRLSADGTRLGIIAKNPAVPGALSPQVWAARRNMNLPPSFTQVEGQSLHDTTSKYTVTAIVGQTRTITVNAVDPEQDALTYLASFLQPGMTFDAGTRTLTWPNVPPPEGIKYPVKFWVTTASGGTDAIIVEILTVSGFSASAHGGRATEGGIGSDSPTPTNGRFAITAPQSADNAAKLTIFDLSGRRVAVVRGMAGSQLIWEGKDDSGDQVHPGVYYYILSVGSTSRRGRFVLLQ